MRRGGAWVGVALLWFLLGPWVLVLAFASLLHPAVRERFVPERPPRRTAGIGSAVVVAAALLVWVVPDGWLPIPPGPGRWATPTYVGRAALDHPVTGLRVPQHPHLARNGTAGVSGDAWATSAVRWPGPEGDRTEVDTAWFGREHCTTLLSLDRGRLLGLCAASSGLALHLLDADSMHVVATRELPAAAEDGQDGPPWPDVCGRKALFVDDQGDAVVATDDRKLWQVSTSGDELRVRRTTDLSSRVAADDCVVGLLPGWRSGTWFVTERGRVGLVADAGAAVRVLDLEEQVTSPVAVDATGLYVVTAQALYRISADAAGHSRQRA